MRNPPAWLVRLKAQAVRAVRDEGESVRATSDLLHLAPETVVRYCREAGHLAQEPAREPEPDETEPVPDWQDRVLALVRSGASYSAAGRAAHVPEQRVRRWCIRNGVTAATTHCDKTSPQWIGVRLGGVDFDRARILSNGSVEVVVRRNGGLRHVFRWSEVEAWKHRRSFDRPGNHPWQDGPAAARTQASA